MAKERCAMDRNKEFTARILTLLAESVRSIAMSKKKFSLTKKLAAGAALVALSGAVPQPFVGAAQAASATINAAGTFAGGISMGTTKTNLLFGSVVASADTGKLTVTPAGGTATSNGFFNGGEQNGTIAFNAVAGGLPVNVTASGFTAGLALADAGEGTQGSITLAQFSLTGPFATPTTVVLKTATPAKVATLTGTAGAAATADINVGGVVSWSGARPIGSFSVPVTITITY